MSIELAPCALPSTVTLWQNRSNKSILKLRTNNPGEHPLFLRLEQKDRPTDVPHTREPAHRQLCGLVKIVIHCCQDAFRAQLLQQPGVKSGPKWHYIGSLSLLFPYIITTKYITIIFMITVFTMN